MEQFFILDIDKIEVKLAKLNLVGDEDYGWTLNYIDEQTAQRWKLTYFHPELQGGGIKVLKRCVSLSTNDLIDIAISSSYVDDIIGASFELLERENKKNEDFRDNLVNRLSQFNIMQLTGLDQERIKIIISKTDLCSALNRKEIIGKSVTDIMRDAEYYQQVSKKAKIIFSNVSK